MVPRIGMVSYNFGPREVKAGGYGAKDKEVNTFGGHDSAGSKTLTQALASVPLSLGVPRPLLVPSTSLSPSADRTFSLHPWWEVP